MVFHDPAEDRGNSVPHAHRTSVIIVRKKWRGVSCARSESWPRLRRPNIMVRRKASGLEPDDMSTEPLGHDADQPSRLATMLSLIVGAITVVWRLVPHPAHCLPLGALGIYGGAKLSGWKPVLLPLAVLLISDFGLWILAGFDLQYLVGLWR